MSAMDAEFTKWLVTLGVGGILAAFMFTFYRKDVKQYTELWRSTADQLISVVKDNTASNVKLITMLESLERNTIRKQDIEQIVDSRVRDYGRSHTPNKTQT
jgi:hypothetical protein